MRFSSALANDVPVLVAMHYDVATNARSCAPTAAIESIGQLRPCIPFDARPMLAALSSQRNQAVAACRLKTYGISVEKEDILEGTWPVAALPAGAALLLPLSPRLGGGVLVAAETSVSLHCDKPADVAIRCSFPAVYFQCFATVGDDDTRFLLGDHTGGLHLLTVAHDDDGTVVGLSMRTVGATTCGSAISYLDSGVCFVGSRNANSQLIRLLSSPVDDAEPDNFVQVRTLSHGRHSYPV